MKSSFIQNDESNAMFVTLLTLFLLALMNLLIRMNLKGKLRFGYREVMTLFICVFSTYILWSYLITGLFMGNFRSEQPLYVLNLVVFLLLIRKTVSPFQDAEPEIVYLKDRWTLYFSSIIGVIVLLSLILYVAHGGFPNANLRFPV